MNKIILSLIFLLTFSNFFAQPKKSALKNEIQRLVNDIDYFFNTIDSPSEIFLTILKSKNMWGTISTTALINMIDTIEAKIEGHIAKRFKKKKTVRGLNDFFKPKEEYFNRFRFIFFTFICSLYGARLSDQINNLPKIQILKLAVEFGIILGIVDFALNISREYISRKKEIKVWKNLRKSLRETILHSITVGTSYTITKAMKNI